METAKVFDGKKTLVTGGMGFIGSTLSHALSAAGAKVTVVDSLIPEHGGNPFNLDGVREKIEVHVADVRDENAMRRLIEGKDYLFNLAGQTSHMDSMQDPYTDLDINCRAQLSILEVCRKYNTGIKLVFASTRQLYGKPDRLPVDENHLSRPADVNGINKMAGEWYHILYNNVYGIRACALRLTNTIGPRMRIKDARQTFAGLWIRQLIEGQPFEVWGGEQKRDFTFVDDAVAAFLMAAASDKANGQIFNLGGGPAVTLKELAELLVKLHKKGSYEIREFPKNRKAIDIGDYYADFSRIESTLGWRPAHTLEQALEKTLEFYRQNLKHYV